MAVWGREGGGGLLSNDLFRIKSDIYSWSLDTQD